MRLTRGKRAGFTLIELMITVGIVGILAVLAVYGVNKYIANTKSTEARNSLGVIAAGAAAQYEREGMGASVLQQSSTAALSRQLCLSASQSVPAAPAAIQGRKYQSATNDWDVDKAGNSGFACLKFRLDEPQYYMYSYTVAGSANPGDSFTAAAQGDLNGDGNLSLFSITGQINNSYILNVAPNILEVRPDE